MLGGWKGKSRSTTEMDKERREGNLKMNGLLSNWLSHCCQLHVDSLNIVVGHQPGPPPLLLLLLKEDKNAAVEVLAWNDVWRELDLMRTYLDDVCLCTDSEPLL